MECVFDNLYSALICRQSNLILFLVILSIYSGIDFLINYFVLDRNFYVQSLGHLFENERVTRLAVQIEKIQLIRYFIFPGMLFCKIAFASFCIYAVTYFENLDLPWKEAFHISLIAEIAFLLSAIVRLAYFLFFPPASINELQDFAPLSVYSLYNTRAQPHFSYLLQRMNVFELTYCYLLIKGLRVYTTITMRRSFLLIAKSYGAGWIMWTLLVVFLLMQIL